VLDEIDHHGAGRDQHRIGGLDLPLHLNDGGAEGIAGAGNRRDQAGAGELLEIAIGGLRRDAELLGGSLDGPLRALDREQSERHQEAIAAAAPSNWRAHLSLSLETVETESQKMGRPSSQISKILVL
jgi:hypothetical protein